MVPAVIRSPGAAAVLLESVETCVKMVSCLPLSQRKSLLCLNFQWKHPPPWHDLSILSCFLCAGCPKGFYGKQCNKKCNCANNGRCHRTYGACLCDSGLYGRFCHLRKSHSPNITGLSPLNSHEGNSRFQKLWMTDVLWILPYAIKQTLHTLIVADILMF